MTTPSIYSSAVRSQLNRKQSGMVTRFTRVTVVGNDRQVDVSLPAEQPIITHFPELCDLLSLRTDTPIGPWTLSTVAGGVLNPHGSLAEAGITDADVLYLNPPQKAAQLPFVEDVVDEVAATLDNANTIGRGLAWTDKARTSGICALSASAFLAMIALATGTLSDPLAAVLLLALVGLILCLLARLLRDRGGIFFAGAGAIAWLASFWSLGEFWQADTATQICTAALGLGIGLAVFSWVGRQWLVMSVAGLVLIPFTGVAAALVGSGLGLERAAAVLVVVALLSAGITPQLAVSSSGIVGLLRAEEKADPIERETLDNTIDTGQAVLNGLVAVTALVAAASTVVLMLSSGVTAPLLGAVTGIVFGLRARAFTRVGQVAPMLAVPVASAVAAGAALPSWLGIPEQSTGWVSAGVLFAVGFLVLGLGLARLNEVAGARLRRTFDTVEATAVIITVPLVLAVFNAYAWVRDIAGG